MAEEEKKDRPSPVLCRFVDRSICTFPFMYMSDGVHIGEKWVYVAEVEGKIILLLKEKNLRVRPGRSRRHTTKVTFLSATCRPWFKSHTRMKFDSKNGIPNRWKYNDLRETNLQEHLNYNLCQLVANYAVNSCYKQCYFP